MKCHEIWITWFITLKRRMLHICIDIHGMVRWTSPFGKNNVWWWHGEYMESPWESTLSMPWGNGMCQSSWPFSWRHVFERYTRIYAWAHTHTCNYTACIYFHTHTHIYKGHMLTYHTPCRAKSIAHLHHTRNQSTDFRLAIYNSASASLARPCTANSLSAKIGTELHCLRILCDVLMMFATKSEHVCIYIKRSKHTHTNHIIYIIFFIFCCIKGTFRICGCNLEIICRPAHILVHICHSAK